MTNDLIEGTIKDIQEALAELKHRRDALNTEIQSKEERLAAWTKELQKLSSQPSDAAPRRPRGANRETIVNTLKGVLDGLAAVEIQRATGLAWSSVQGTLRRNAILFVEEGGRWRLRGNSKEEVARMNGAA